MKREALVQELVEDFIKLRQLSKRQLTSQSGLSTAQAGLLFLLAHHHRVTGNKIARLLGVSASAASQMMDPLVEKGLVDRVRDDNDRRIVYLVLTTDGHQLLKQHKQQIMEHLRQALDNLSDQELNQLGKLHKKIITHIEKES
jgi:DNA-binding MarR family transcriptional regulator